MLCLSRLSYSLFEQTGRAGAANLDVIQEVEYVKKEAKVVYLLECLQKTAPPVVSYPRIPLVYCHLKC